MNSEQFKALQQKIDAIAEDRLDEKISPAMVNPYDKIPDDIKQQIIKDRKKRSQEADPSRNEIPDNIQQIINKNSAVPFTSPKDAERKAKSLEKFNLRDLLDKLGYTDVGKTLEQKEQIGEDEVDAQKMKALDAFSNALADMNRAFVALAKIDQAEGNSGSGDLTDQLATVDKHIENLYQVDRRMFDIIPK